MHFTLKQLRYVEMAGRSGSIARAAEELNISQSSVTAAIDAIEGELGFDLFLRTPAKGARATPAGQDVLQMVGRFLGEARVLESELTAMAGDPTGTLRLACYATAAPFVLPPLLREFGTRFPGVRIDVREGDMASILGLLDDGAVDMALTYYRTIGNDHDFVPLFRARPYALLPVAHPLAAKSEVALDELVHLPMIMLDLPHSVEYYTELFTDKGLTPKVVHSSKTSEMARALAASGFGFSVLNIRDPANVEERSGYASRPISDDVEAPQFGIALSRAARRPAMIERFIEMCAEMQGARRFDDLLVLPQSLA